MRKIAEYINFDIGISVIVVVPKHNLLCLIAHSRILLILERRIVPLTRSGSTSRRATLVSMRRNRVDPKSFDLTTPCPKCGYKIPPNELMRLDREHIRKHAHVYEKLNRYMEHFGQGPNKEIPCPLYANEAIILSAEQKQIFLRSGKPHQTCVMRQLDTGRATRQFFADIHGSIFLAPLGLLLATVVNAVPQANPASPNSGTSIPMPSDPAELMKIARRSDGIAVAILSPGTSR
jgi:hypothetical protein